MSGRGSRARFHTRGTYRMGTPGDRVDPGVLEAQYPTGSATPTRLPIRGPAAPALTERRPPPGKPGPPAGSPGRGLPNRHLRPRVTTSGNPMAWTSGPNRRKGVACFDASSADDAPVTLIEFLLAVLASVLTASAFHVASANLAGQAAVSRERGAAPSSRPTVRSERT